MGGGGDGWCGAEARGGGARVLLAGVRLEGRFAVGWCIYSNLLAIYYSIHQPFTVYFSDLLAIYL